MLDVRVLRAAVPVCAVAFGLSACATVKPEEHEADLAQLRAELMGEIQSGDQQTAADAGARVDEVARQVTALSNDLDALSAEFDTKIASLEARLHVDMPIHFAFDEAEIRDVDKPALDQFAAVIREHHPNVMVTVEGFTDPAGEEEYNQWLGQQRANAVRQYLVESGGIDEAKVKAVSYGEAANRMVDPGAWGEDGVANRRVALVIEYTGSTR
jgi:peptidoglycan-associated lipoprotein